MCIKLLSKLKLCLCLIALFVILPRPIALARNIKAQVSQTPIIETTDEQTDAVKPPPQFKLPDCDGFEPFGRWHRSVLISLAVDSFNRSERMEAFRANGKGLVATGLTVHSLKWIFNKKRPLDRGEARWNSSFPSGHSGVAFCQFGALGELHSDLKVPLAVLACFVGRSRIRSGHHRLGDVLTGGAIGYLWGRYYGRKENDKNNSNKTANISLVNFNF